MFSTLVFPLVAALALLTGLAPFVAVEEDDITGLVLVAGVFICSGSILFLGAVWIFWRRKRVVARYVRLALAVSAVTATLLMVGMYLVDPDDGWTSDRWFGGVVLWLGLSTIYFCVLLLSLGLLWPLRRLDAIVARVLGVRSPSGS